MSSVRLCLGLFVVSLLVSPTTIALAEEFSVLVDGNKLLEYCANPASTIYSECLGYTSAIADAMAVPHLAVLGWYACFREHQTRGQLADVVKLWLQNHPEKRDFGAAGLVAHAFQEAFPCPP
jgi:hypothetical protein